MRSNEYSVAMRTFGVWEADTQERFDFSVWYPGSVSQTEGVREGWVVEAVRRGRIVPGFYPVILLSHDAVSSRFANNDLAASLASGGFIVIAPTHMRDNQSDSADFYTARSLRGRPRHLLRALETVLDSPDFSPYTDESRIGLIGVGFGGITVLQLVGAVPDPSGLADYCGVNAGEDAFCAPWARDRLALLQKDMGNIEKKEGKKAFAPSLDLYAPALVPAPVIAAAPPPEPKKPVRERELPSLMRMLLGKDDDTDEGQEEENASARAPAANATAAANLHVALDFQGGALFGGTDSGTVFVHIALPDSPQFRVSVADDSAATSPEALAVRPAAPLAHRRPAHIRRVLGIALVAPAGGMLFNRESLSGVQVPVALVEAGQDSLYPPQRHSQAFGVLLPVPPEMLSLPVADHFSLFARCSKDTMANLGEACGRLVGEARENVAEKRNRFVGSFFRAVLGEPLLPVFPSGFVAAPRVHQ